MDIQLGRELFMFDGFNHWCDTAKDKFEAANVTSSKTLCVDAKGRICAWGTHFMDAAKDNAYPVRVYLLRDDMLGTPNVKSISYLMCILPTRRPCCVTRRWQALVSLKLFPFSPFSPAG